MTDPIDPLEDRMVALLIEGVHTDTALAERLGIGRMFAHRIRQRPRVVSRYREVAGAGLREITAKAQLGAHEAVDYLRSVVSSKDKRVTTQDRVTAARTILDVHTRLLEGVTLADEVAELKAQANAVPGLVAHTETASEDRDHD